MLHKSKLIVLVLAFFCISKSVRAQTESTAWSISPKLGGFVNPDQSDPAMGMLLGLEGNFMKNNFLLSLSQYYGNELLIYGSGPDRHFNQSAFLFGRYYQANFFRFDYQAGIAGIWGTKHADYHSEGFLSGHYDTENYFTPGLILKVGGEFILSDSYAMGSHLLVNLNRELPTVQYILSFSFGKLKTY